MERFCLICCMLLTGCLAAQTYAQPRIRISPKPDWVSTPTGKPGSVGKRTITQGYYIDLYDYQLHAEKKASYFHIIRNIVSEAGIQSASEIWATVNPAYETLQFHSVTVWRNGKAINQLKPDKFKVVASESEGADFIYNGSYDVYLILDDIRVGDRIEYAYSTLGNNPVFEGHFFANLYLQSDVPVAQLYTSVLISPSRHLDIRCMNSAKLPDKETTADKLNRYEWQDSSIPAAVYEDYQPSWYNAYRYVQLTDFRDWKEVGAWAARVNPLKKDLGGDLATRIGELKQASANDTKLFISKVVRLVQDEIRYTGIEIGEYSHRANDPEKIYRQRYGDCKDKSLLLASILRQEGIEASVALVSTRLGSHVEGRLPTPDAFNHAVVYFKYNGRPYWVDPTVSYQGGALEELRFPVKGKGLLLHQPVPDFAPGGFDIDGNVNCEEVYKLTAADSSSATLQVRTTYTGWRADEMRASLAYSSLAETEKNYLEYYQRLYPDAEINDSLLVADDREANILTVKEAYHIPLFLAADSATGFSSAGFYANMISDQLPEISGKRKSPVAVNYPSDMDYTIRIISPTGWAIPRENYFIDRQSYLFDNSAESRGDTLILNYQFKYHAPEVAADKSAEFAADIKRIKNEKLSYGLQINPNGAVGHLNNYSWWAFVYSLLLLAGLVWLAIRFNKHKEQQYAADGATQPMASYDRIGGWLILIMIGLALSPFRMLWDLTTIGYFNSDTWQAYDQAGLPKAALYRSLCFFELTASLYMLALGPFCFVLLVMRKRLFPHMAILFYVSNLVTLVVDLSLLPLLGHNPFADPENIRAMTTALFAAAIWVPYLMRSSRVKGTFVLP